MNALPCCNLSGMFQFKVDVSCKAEKSVLQDSSTGYVCAAVNSCTATKGMTVWCYFNLILNMVLVGLKLFSANYRS